MFLELGTLGLDPDGSLRPKLGSVLQEAKDRSGSLKSYNMFVTLLGYLGCVLQGEHPPEIAGKHYFPGGVGTEIPKFFLSKFL